MVRGLGVIVRRSQRDNAVGPAPKVAILHSIMAETSLSILSVLP